MFFRIASSITLTIGPQQHTQWIRIHIQRVDNVFVYFQQLQEFLEPAIGSEYCSSNVILSSLHQWVNETPSTSAQVSEERIQTFLNLVKKVPIKLWNEKVFAEIFLDDQRLRDNEMCRSFRDEFLSDLLEIANRKYLKRRAEDIVMKLKQRRIHEESAPSTSTETEIFTRSASTVHVKPATETPCGSGPKQIISGGDGSDCIGYFTSNENGSWFIGSFNLAVCICVLHDEILR